MTILFASTPANFSKACAIFAALAPGSIPIAPPASLATALIGTAIICKILLVLPSATLPAANPIFFQTEAPSSTVLPNVNDPLDAAVSNVEANLSTLPVTPPLTISAAVPKPLNPSSGNEAIVLGINEATLYPLPNLAAKSSSTAFINPLAVPAASPILLTPCIA